MADFRHRTPHRRTKHSLQTEYTKFKPELRTDFNERCGYCGDHDFFRTTFYEIDHFVPRHQWKTIMENTYSNLVYSCRLCNNSKRAKWPSNNEQVHNDGIVGFIDPCDSSYSDQFKRGKDGSIIALTNLGKWMWTAMNFGNPAHRIIWNMEELREAILQLSSIVENGTFSSQLSADILKLVADYFTYENQLKGTPLF